MDWLQTLVQEVRRGRNSFLLHGAVGDGYPMPGGPNVDVLHPWHVVTAKALSEVLPKALYVTYDAANGFVFPLSSAASLAQFNELMEDRVQVAASDDDDSVEAMVARVNAASNASSPTATLRAKASAAPEAMQKLIERAGTIPVVLMLHDMDAMHQQQDPEDLTRAFLRIKRIAEDETFRLNGSVIILSAANTLGLPDLFRRPDAPFMTVLAGRPSEQERMAYLQRMCGDGDAEAEGDEETEDQKPERRSLPFASDTALKLWKAKGFKPMTEARWRKLAEGDIVVYRAVNNGGPASDKLKRVLEVREDGVVLSLADDLMQPHVFTGTTAPLLYGYSKDTGYQQRRSASSPWVPMGMWGSDGGGAASGQSRNSHSIGVCSALESSDFIDRLTSLAEANEAAAIGGANPQQNSAAGDAAQRVLSALPERPFLIPECGLQTTARITGGMAYRDLASIMRKARSAGDRLTQREVREMRQQIIRGTYHGLLTLVEPRFGFDYLAGMPHIIAYLRKVRDNMLAGNKVKVPKGLLFAGPPGTGKSLACETFAFECGMPMVTFDETRTMWHGETERLRREQLLAARAMAPLVWYRDEVDEEDSGRGGPAGDSGVSGRIRKGTMEFLGSQDIQGLVLPISCTNMPNRLDAALTRADRTDEKMAFLMPDEETRSQLFDVKFKEFMLDCPDVNQKWDTGDCRERAVQATAGMTGADIKVIVRHAVEASPVRGGVAVVGPKELLFACKDFVPQSKSSPRKIAAMEMAAILAVSKESYRPKGWEKTLQRHQATLEGVEYVDPDEAAAEAARIAKTAGIRGVGTDKN